MSEKKLTSTATYDTFDEIYTNFDLSVDETYAANTGYPFDYPTRWLNDPSMNKRIAIRRLDAIPTSHSFKLGISAVVECAVEPDDDAPSLTDFEKTITVDVTEHDNLIKVLNYICSEFSFVGNTYDGKLTFDYSNTTNRLEFKFIKYTFRESLVCEFVFTGDTKELLRFLNQDTSDEQLAYLDKPTNNKTFDEVWNRDRLHFHASFSTSRRRFIGKRGDFYQTLSLLYPPPTNESTFYIRMTSNGIKNILLRYCEFDIQLCFIVNYKKTKVI